MAGMSHEFAILAAGIVTAVVLLMFGAAAGYWAGARTVPQAVFAAPPIDAAWRNERSQLLSQLDRCIEGSELAAGQSVALAALGRSAVDALPAELMKAIDRLVDTTGGLAAQLHDVQVSTRQSKVQDNPRQLPSASAVTEVSAKPARTLKIADVAATAATSLTTEQMSDVMGGRKHLGDSTLGLETKRYPYDCYQQLVPWNDTEPTPTLEQFVKVRCHDISVNGISFFWPHVPDFESVVISIGMGGKLIFMLAQICQHKAVFMHDEVAFLVGCRYLRRMEELTAQWHTADELVDAV